MRHAWWVLVFVSKLARPVLVIAMHIDDCEDKVVKLPRWPQLQVLSGEASLTFS